MNGNVLKVTTRNKDHIRIIDMEGDFTLFADEVVNNTVRTLINNGETKIILNFANVGYINSSGIAIIIGLVTLLSNKGGRLRACGLIPHFQKVFNMVGLTQYMDLFDSEKEALASFNG